jgi:hypothetical protein
MGSGPSGPPNKSGAFSTDGMRNINDFINALNNLGAQGFPVGTVAVPAPVSSPDGTRGAWWVGVGGYSK